MPFSALYGEPVNGDDILVFIGGVIVGHQRNAQRTESNDLIDISSKIARQRRILAGRYQTDLTLDALWVRTASGLDALRTAIRSGDPVTLAVQFQGSGWESASAIASGSTEDWPDQGEATVSIDLAIDGSWS